MKHSKTELLFVFREIAHDMKVPWREYWPFLNTFIDIASTEGLQLLEQYLEDRFNETLNQVRLKPNFKLQKKKHPTFQSIHESDPEVNKSEEEFSPISHLCQALQACSLADTHAQSNIYFT